MFVNDHALKRANITSDTPELEGGTIVRDETTGEPTGELKQSAAQRGVDGYERTKMEFETVAEPETAVLESETVVPEAETDVFVPDEYENLNDCECRAEAAFAPVLKRCV